MALDPSIILRGQAPDILGSMQRGSALAQQHNEMQRQNALAAFLRENGEGLMSGDQNALAQYAQYDPTAAFNMHTQNRNNARADEQMAWQRQRAGQQDARQSRLDQRGEQEWQMKLDQYARGLSAEQAAAEASQIEQSVQMGLAAQTPQEWDQIVTQAGAPDLVGQFDNRQALAQRYMSMAEILKQQSGPVWRPATAAEAQTYGAQAGQINTQTGQFQRTPLDSGMAIDVDPNTGAVSVRQGAGAGSSKPLTEGQSKDAVYATRAEGALATLDTVANELTDRASIVADQTPLGIGRGIQSDQYQIARTAGDEFLQAILRKDTGAAITSQEMQEYGRTYLPQPGDGQAVLQQKQQARRRALEALKAGMPPDAILAQERALDASGSERITTPAQRMRFNPETGDFE